MKFYRSLRSSLIHLKPMVILPITPVSFVHAYVQVRYSGMMYIAGFFPVTIKIENLLIPVKCQEVLPIHSLRFRLASFCFGVGVGGC